MSHLLLEPVGLLRILLCLPFLFFLPGHATLLAVAAPGLPSRASERLYLSILLSVLLVSPVGLLLAELGRFSLTAVVLLAAAYSGLLLWLQWRRGSGSTRLWPKLESPDRWDLALLVLVLVAIPLYARPHEVVLGGTDAGVYVNTGANLAQTGRLTIHDPLVAETPLSALPDYFRQHPEPSAVTFSRFPGFFIENADRGLVIPQFLHLHPMWMGLLYSMAGVWGELLLTPLWAVLGGASLYFAAAAAFGRRVGTLTLLLLTACPLQIWFARYPTSEALTQFLLYGATYATIRYLARPVEPGRRPTAYDLAAGLGWGALLLARVDTFFTAAVPVLIVISLCLGRQWRRRHWWFALPWLLVSLQAVLHAVLIAHDYTYDTIRIALSVLGLEPVHAIGVMGVGLLALGALFALPRSWRRCTSWVTARGRLWGTLLAALIILSVSYGYFLRPVLEEGRTYEYWYGGHVIQTTNHENLVRLGWYLSPLGLALGSLGVAWAVWRKLNRPTVLFLGLGVFSSYLYLYNILNNPHHVYALRRYVPAVVPLFVSGAAIFLDRLWAASRRWTPGRVTVGVLGLALLGQLLWVDRVFLPQVDNRGLTDQIAGLDAALPSDDLVLFDDASSVGWGDTLGTALTFLHDRQVMTMGRRNTDPASLSERLAAWTEGGAGVTLIPGTRPLAFNLPNWGLEPAGEYVIRYDALESSYTHFPQELSHHTMSVEFYSVVPASDAGQVTLPYRIDIGHGDFGSLLAGFFGKETTGDRTYRWTAPEASLRIPADALRQADSLSLSLAAARPGGNTLPVYLELNGTPWTTLTVQQDFGTHRLPLPAIALAGDTVTLTLGTRGWNPQAAGVSVDDRDLGVMLEWVELTGTG